VGALAADERPIGAVEPLSTDLTECICAALRRRPAIVA
jgi:hypothetical protein